MESYKMADTLKKQALKEKLARAHDDIKNERVVEGDVFFEELLAGKYD